MAENLTHLRRSKGITQEKLVDFLGISKASVSKWETGQSLPDIAQLPRNPQMVLSTLAQDLANPVFAPLFDNPEYQKLLMLLK